MFKYIKGLFNKKEIARIKELEEELEALKAVHDEKVIVLEAELVELDGKLVELSEQAFEMHMQLQYLEEEEDPEIEKCSCGGEIVPMYEEHPNWIKFCKSCDARMEDFDASPIQEPA